MLYLAEIVRKNRGMLGSSRPELKLLACQRAELSWSAVPGEEVIPAPDDVTFNTGTLVLVELSAGKQVQRCVEAGRQLVSILQNFSRLQEKAKTQEEEIEQWKQSLTYQSQELNRREMELEAAQDQVQQIEEDLERLEKQRQEIEAAQAEVDRLREEFERKSQELEGAWAQLRGETNKLEERQAALQSMTALDEEQARLLQSLLDRLADPASVGPLQEQLNSTFAVLMQQQEHLNGHWQQLEEQRAATQQGQADLEQQIQRVQQRWQTWQQAQTTLEQARAELEHKQNLLQAKQHQAQELTVAIQTQTNLHQAVSQLKDGSAGFNLEALEQMPLEALQATVGELEKELEKLSRFVSSQEEELTLQQQEIDQIRQQIAQASEYDRLRLETEIADEQDRYQMLNETLVGQRRNLQDRQITLKQHKVVLAKRQGFPLPNDEPATIDVSPVLALIEQQQQQYTTQLQSLEQEITVLQTELEPCRTQVSQQAEAQTAAWTELRQLEEQLRTQAGSVAERLGKVDAYQAVLQPIQDNLNQLRQQTESALADLQQQQESSAAQSQVIAEMRETIQRLTNHTPELAMS
ncbi:MAG: pilus motility taxis protein HmpF [Elainella sp.]